MHFPIATLPLLLLFSATGLAQLAPRQTTTTTYEYETCQSSDTKDECCARTDPDALWCYGTSFVSCYIPGQTECCSDETICSGAGCCRQSGTTSITPDASEADDPVGKDTDDDEDGAAALRAGAFAMVAAGAVGLILL